MIFQSLDDKEECVGIYSDGKLHFNDIPDNLTKTWKYTGSLKDREVESAWVYCGGQSLDDVCPPDLQEAWQKIQRKMRAFRRSFEIGKINLREHCFFDLVPQDALLEFCELKNKITQHVFENYEKPDNYEHLNKANQLLYKIKYQDLMLDNSNCRNLFVNSSLRSGSQRAMRGPRHIDYNLFGTVTGRLSTKPVSFPILTIKKELRRLIRPHNDWFLSLDYNGAEVRTLLALSEQEQPRTDVHDWNIHNIFENPEMEREEAKTLFFAWLYNPDADHIKTNYYDRQKILDKYYDGEYINTVFGRRIQVENRKAFNYLIQSTTADLVIERAVAIDEFLKNKKSFISHIVHDEIVIDFSDEERDLVEEIRNLFATNKLDRFVVNLKAGKDYYNLGTLTV